MPRLLLPSPPCLVKLSLIFIATLLLVPNQLVSAEAISPGNVYQQKCANCHGKNGGGVADRYEGSLYGDESIAELALRIEETMPQDEPEDCVGEEARAVAEFIYHEFYSKAARQKKGLLVKPRIELTRLTVPQYRNAVADLVAAFISQPRNKRNETLTGQGLRGEYYESKKMSKTESRQLVRVDPQIDFNFADRSPAKGIPRDQFAIVWQGSLFAKDTGYYDFRIHTPNGVRLYLNSDAITRRGKMRDDSSEAIQSRLIDAWVSSGKMRAPTGRMFLLGGRRYPIRLEFFKYKDAAASIHLEWKSPHGVWSTIDASCLSPASAQRTFVVDTPFPADDRSLGYERGSAVSQEWHTAITNAALATADEVLMRLPLLTNTRTTYRPKQGEDKELVAKKAYELAKKSEQLRNEKLPKFAKSFASAAFRRPLTSAEKRLYGETLFLNNESDSALRRAVLLTLTSPHFLYTNLPSNEKRLQSHTIASQLAFTLWDSLPDAELRRLARLERLATSAQIEAQADRMLNDPRTRVKLQGFFRHWLELEERDLAKDQQMYPDFDEAVIADLRRSLELFVDRVVWSPASDYRQLLQADYLLLNDRLRKLYSKTTNEPRNKSVADNSFVSIDSDREGRSGILTHPYLLSAFAYHDNTSPIHRGVFLTRNIVGRQLKPPPVAVAFENNNFAPHLTMREKVTELTRDQACVSCHEVINPLGFALENFDAVGRWRNSDNNKPIDTKSDYTSAEGTKLKIDSARDIADFAVASPVAQRAFIRQLFQHLVQQSPDAYSPQIIEELRQRFVADNFHIRKLMVNIAAITASHTATDQHSSVQHSPDSGEPKL